MNMREHKRSEANSTRHFFVDFWALCRVASPWSGGAQLTPTVRVIAFPWYLSMRYKILTGTARLREEFAPGPLKDGEMSVRGLIQPWRGRPL